MERVMNKKTFQHSYFVFLFSIILLITPIVSYAEYEVKKIKLSELSTVLANNKGKVIILDLWATWCPPCKKEIPGFINLYKKYKDKGLEIIGISFDENGQKVVPPFMKKMGMNYPVYLDGGDIGPAFNLEAYPTTIIYDKEGKIVSRHEGYVSEEEFENQISKLLKK